MIKLNMLSLLTALSISTHLHGMCGSGTKRAENIKAAAHLKTDSATKLNVQTAQDYEDQDLLEGIIASSPISNLQSVPLTRQPGAGAGQ